MSRIQTRFVQMDPDQPDPEILAEAAAAILRGEIVAFPTETVYGLGANALDSKAVEGIFRAKGRPSHNPLIVHVGSIESAQSLTSDWPNYADKLAASFWPGPLTLVLWKNDMVPYIVTAGNPTVAIRIPAHPIALGLIRAARVPIAAPSANRSEQLSPTLASHVLEGLNGRINMILDGGPTSRGLESTVIDLTSELPKILRPGLITPGVLESVIGPIMRSRMDAPVNSNESLPSPGMMLRHYAPKARLEISASNSSERIRLLASSGESVGWLTLESCRTIEGCIIRKLPQNAQEYAHYLYAALHELDGYSLSVIVVDAVPEGEEWDAVRDRISRAAYVKD